MHIFLHIGADKCGSTGIQAGLYQNAFALNALGLTIPVIGLTGSHGHGRLFQSALELVDLTRLDQNLQNPERVRRILHEQLKSNRVRGNQSAILSWEGLYYLNKDNLRRLSELFTGYRVTVVLYVREQALIVQSGILQNIKDPYYGCESISNVRKNTNYRSSTNRNFNSIVELWKNYFSPENILVKTYDRSGLLGEDSFVDLLSTALQQKVASLNLITQESNPSLDVPSALVLDSLCPAIDRKSLLYNHISKFLIDLIRTNGSGLKYFLTEDQVEGMRRYYAASNSKLIAMYSSNIYPLNFSFVNCYCSEDQYRDAALDSIKLLEKVTAFCDVKPSIIDSAFVKLNSLSSN